MAYSNVSFQIMSYLDGHYILGSEYVTEIFFWVKELERRPGRAYKKISPQLSKRGQLVEWSRDVSCKLGLCESTFHLAVRLIDLFMDGHEIAVSAASAACRLTILFSAHYRILNSTWWHWVDCCLQQKWKKKTATFPNAPNSTVL